MTLLNTCVNIVLIYVLLGSSADMSNHVLWNDREVVKN